MSFTELRNKIYNLYPINNIIYTCITPLLLTEIIPQNGNYFGNWIILWLGRLLCIEFQMILMGFEVAPIQYKSYNDMEPPTLRKKYIYSSVKRKQKKSRKNWAPYMLYHSRGNLQFFTKDISSWCGCVLVSYDLCYLKLNL